MKQHISLEQLNELSEKGKEEYRHWAFERGYGKHLNGELHWDKDFSPTLPTIGQMIEFLDDNRSLPGFRISPPIDSLCDALWEVVYEILEK